MNKKDILIKTLHNNRDHCCCQCDFEESVTRVDLTKNKSYTLSTVSKETVGSLDDKVLVKAYFSENLPIATLQ